MKHPAVTLLDEPQQKIHTTDWFIRMGQLCVLVRETELLISTMTALNRNYRAYETTRARDEYELGLLRDEITAMADEYLEKQQ